MTPTSEVIRLAREAGIRFGEFDVPFEDRQVTRTMGAQPIENIARLISLAKAEEREACAELCLSLRDTTERAKASKRVEEALATNDMQKQLSALRHDSDVSLYNCAFENAANAIRARTKEAP